jgi:hypothetical protein
VSYNTTANDAAAIIPTIHNIGTKNPRNEAVVDAAVDAAVD